MARKTQPAKPKKHVSNRVAKAAPESKPLLERLGPAGVAGALAALHLLLVAGVFDPTIFTGGDNGVYVALSRSLVELRSYLSIHDPVPTPHTYYPPGYPTILALASLLGLHPWVEIKFVTAAFSIAGVVLSYLWLRRRNSDRIALWAAFMVAITPGLLSMSHYELSDVPFWALSTLALWAMEAVPRAAYGRIAVAGLATAAAYLTRTAALPMVVAMIVWLLLERRWKQVLLFAALVFPAMAWWYWWTHTHSAGNVYGNQFWYLDVYQPELGRANFIDLLKRIPANTMAYGGVMLPLLFAGRPNLLPLGLLLLALAVVGWALRLRRFGMSELFFPMYGGMLFLCPPPWAGERYVLPIIPLALAYAAEAVLWPLKNRRTAITVATVGATLLFVLMAASSFAQRASEASVCRRAYRIGEPYGCLEPQWQDYLSLAGWARTALPSDAVVISRKPGLFFALSSRRGVDIPKTTRPEEFFRIAQESKARYIVIDRVDFLTTFYSVPIVAQYIDSFCLVQPGRTQGTFVLGILLDNPLAATPPGQQPELKPCSQAFPQRNGS